MTTATATNIEARAIATNLKLYAIQFAANERELAAEARHGGRALTDKIAQRVSVLLTLVGEEQDLVNERWHYSIDPAGGGWDWIARGRASAEGSDRPDYLKTKLALADAEAMLSWPIYRAAIAAQALAPIGEVLYPAGDEDAEWTSDTIEDVAAAYHDASLTPVEARGPDDPRDAQ